MSDDRLDVLIRSIPKERASLAFTRGVMARVRDGSAYRSGVARRLRFVHAIVVVAVVALSVAGSVAWQRHEETKRIESIRAESRRIQAELDALRRESQTQNEIYLGQSGDREYVLDLRQFQAPESGATTVSQTY